LFLDLLDEDGRGVHRVGRGGSLLLDVGGMDVETMDDDFRRHEEGGFVGDSEVDFGGNFVEDLGMGGVILIVRGRGVRIDGMKIVGGGDGVLVIVVIVPEVGVLRLGEVGVR
jgi:hypothetical protein